MGTPLYSIDLECLYCNSAFESLKVKTSKIIKKHQDSDFCTYYKGDNPFFYDAYVCPNCGFAFTKNFSKSLNSEQKNAYQPLAEKWYKRHKFSMARNIGAAIEAYKLAFLSAVTVKEHNLVLAGLSLRIAWFNRYKKKINDEYKFLRISREYYNNSYEEGEIVNYEKPEIYLIYLLGDLSARLGEYNEAIKWFSRVTEHEERGLHQSIENMARDRWKEVKEQLKKEDVNAENIS
ncbi:DUF2225 domain-containing protein [Proteinivorax tanatarense]|uniref:DUF2225 domain-containing protein n=1 Tax=Proteinivorax tanatarense TaxID=1260629 RepID=A0AAU7VNZ3_9FIRM